MAQASGRRALPVAFTSLLVCLLSLAVPKPANAAIIQAFTRPDITPTETVLWTVLGPDLAVVPNPSAFPTVSGGLTTFSQAAGPAQRLTQGSSFSGNFAPGDELLYTGNNTLAPGSTGPMFLDFSTPVSGVAFQIQSNRFGAFDSELVVFAADDTTILATFTRPGTSNSLGNNSAIVLGAFENTGAGTIGRIRFTNTTATAGDINNFAINQLSLAGPAAVPEPSTLALTGLGMLGIGGWLRRRKRIGCALSLARFRRTETGRGYLWAAAGRMRGETS